MNADPWTTLRGLFPKWEPTIEEAGLFRRAFNSRKPEMLRTAIEDYRTYYKYREPNLGEILKRYADLAREVSKNAKGPSDDRDGEEIDEEEFAASVRRIEHDLDIMDKGNLALVLAEVAKMPSLALFVGRLRGEPSEWTHVQRGIVWAQADQMGLLAGSSPSTARPSPSPVPE